MSTTSYVVGAAQEMAKRQKRKEKKKHKILSPSLSLQKKNCTFLTMVAGHQMPPKLHYKFLIPWNFSHLQKASSKSTDFSKAFISTPDLSCLRAQFFVVSLLRGVGFLSQTRPLTSWRFLIKSLVSPPTISSVPSTQEDLRVADFSSKVSIEGNISFKIWC